MPKQTKRRILSRLPKRNDALVDSWSLIHLLTGILLGWIMPAFTALAIMILWEPLEIFVLSPLLYRAGIIFGFETLRNSLSDIIFDTIGVATGAYILSRLVDAPWHLF